VQNGICCDQAMFCTLVGCHQLWRSACSQSTKVQHEKSLAGQFKRQLTVQNFEKNALTICINHGSQATTNTVGNQKGSLRLYNSNLDPKTINGNKQGTVARNYTVISKPEGHVYWSLLDKLSD
jgi:hypothetical protein